MLIARSLWSLLAGATLGVIGHAELLGGTTPSSPAPIAGSLPAQRLVEPLKCPSYQRVAVESPERGHATAGIEGRVVDERGRPLSGATVTADREGQTTTVAVNDDGSFSLDLAAGEYSLSATWSHTRIEEDGSSMDEELYSESVDELALSVGERVIGLDLEIELDQDDGGDDAGEDGARMSGAGHIVAPEVIYGEVSSSGESSTSEGDAEEDGSDGEEDGEGLVVCRCESRGGKR